MNHTSMVGLALAGLLATAPAVVAQQSDSKSQSESQQQQQQPQQAKTDVKQLIEQLGAENYQDRRSAEQQLRKIGSDARGALEDAIKQSSDPEIRWRAHRVLRAIDRDENGTGGLQPQGQAPQAQGFGPGGQANGNGFEQRMLERMQQLLGPQDQRFQDLQQQIEQMQRRMDEMMQGLPTPPAFGVPPGGANLKQLGEGTSIQIGPNGVHVEMDEQGPNGKTEHKVYEADSMDQFRKQYPQVAKKVFGNGHDGAGILQFHFGPNGLTLPDGLTPWTLPTPSAPTTPSAPRVLTPRTHGQLRQLQPRAGSGHEQAEVVQRPKLGVYIAPMSADLRSFLGITGQQGLLVESVADGSLAQKLGVQPKDVVLKVAGHEVAAPQDVAEALASVDPGSKVEVEVNRMGQVETLAADMPGTGKSKASGSKSGSSKAGDKSGDSDK